MEAESSFETSVNFFQNTRHSIPEGRLHLVCSSWCAGQIERTGLWRVRMQRGTALTCQIKIVCPEVWTLSWHILPCCFCKPLQPGLFWIYAFMSWYRCTWSGHLGYGYVLNGISTFCMHLAYLSSPLRSLLQFTTPKTLDDLRKPRISSLCKTLRFPN
jgi:hypothetical protein